MFSIVFDARSTRPRTQKYVKNAIDTETAAINAISGFQIRFRPFTIKYAENAVAMIATKIGTQRFAALILSALNSTVTLMNVKNMAATKPPSTGEITQLAAIAPITGQSTAPNPAAAMPAPITPPTILCVVDTGAPIQVAKLTQSAADIRAAIIAHINVSASAIDSGETIPFEIVLTTSPPATIAPNASKIPAINSAPTMVSAFEPTAGPTLLATSLAPMFIAM